jgi:hypothetical protein
MLCAWDFSQRSAKSNRAIAARGPYFQNRLAAAAENEDLNQLCRRPFEIKHPATAISLPRIVRLAKSLNFLQNVPNPII